MEPKPRLLFILEMITVLLLLVATWMVFFFTEMPVWLEKEAPSTMSRSLNPMMRLPTGVPLRPRTPQPSGW